MKHYIESAPLLPNRGIELSYASKLKKRSRAMTKDVTNKILEFYRTKIKDFSLDHAVAEDSASDDLLVLLELLRNEYEAEFNSFGIISAREMVAKQTDYAERMFNSKVRKLAIPQSEQPNVASYVETITPLATAVVNEFKMSKISESMRPGFGKQPNGRSSASVGFSISGSYIKPEIETAIGASIVENVSLIKSIPSQYLDRIAGAVTRNIQNGGSVDELKKEIIRYSGMTERRAYNIALDQCRKVFNAVTLQEFKLGNIKKFKWIHGAGSVRQREWHLHKHPNGLNGGIFDVDNPPIIDKRYGTRGYPGQLPYCRCFMKAVVEIDGAFY